MTRQGFALLALLASACASAPSSSAPDGRALGASENGAWHWAEMTPSPTLTLEGARASGFAGCNRWFGTPTRGENGAFSIAQIGMTRMACPEPRMQLEQDFIARVQAIRSVRIAGDGALIALDDKNVVIFTLQSGDPSK
jgi:heat shock protein HslJ